MSTAINASHIRREPVSPPQPVIAARGSTGNGWLFQEITKQLPGRGLRDLDAAILTSLLGEAERVMANNDLLLRSTTYRVGTAATVSRGRTVRRPKRHPKTGTSK